jgi:hypothetical protein
MKRYANSLCTQTSQNHCVARLMSLLECWPNTPDRDKEDMDEAVRKVKQPASLYTQCTQQHSVARLTSLLEY